MWQFFNILRKFIYRVHSPEIFRTKFIVKNAERALIIFIFSFSLKAKCPNVFAMVNKHFGISQSPKYMEDKVGEKEGRRYIIDYFKQKVDFMIVLKAIWWV